jgi:energy-coupling factor transporter ATP-binding protein EcfA2
MSLLVSDFRKTVSKSKDSRIKSEAEFGVGYPTGYLVFDFMNGAKVEVIKPDGATFTYNSIGVVDGTMISCVGRSGCGKTTFVMQSSGNIIRPFENSAIFHEDIEGGISDMRKRHLLRMTGEQFKSRYICRNTGITTENFFERIKMIHDLKLENRAEYEYDTGLYDSDGNRIFKLQPTVVILDSLAMLMPEDLANKEELSGNMAAVSIARLNTQLIKTIIPMLKIANIIFFVINHILPDPSLTPKKAQTAWLKQGERVSGGETAIYLANNFLRFDDNSKLKSEDTFGIDGIYVDILLVKSRTNNAGKSVKMVFDYANGFDPELSLFMLLKDQGRINGAGAYLYIGDRDDIKFSQKKFKSKLKEDPEFTQVFMQESFAALEALIKPIKQESEEEFVDTTSIMLKMMREQMAA